MNCNTCRNSTGGEPSRTELCGECVVGRIPHWEVKPEALVVTRHPALVSYLKEIGLVSDDVEVVTHASPSQVKGRRVIGVLPHSLSCEAESLTEIPLAIPSELRGAELSLRELREFAGKPVTYSINRVS